jgi:hypothetical protein
MAARMLRLDNGDVGSPFWVRAGESTGRRALGEGEEDDEWRSNV